MPLHHGIVTDASMLSVAWLASTAWMVHVERASLSDP
jgi:hypothetical protein